MREKLFLIFKKASQVISNQHKKFFGKYLLLTNTISGGCLMFIGEYTAQRIEIGKNYDESKLDKEKLKQLAVVGLTQGPMNHYIYQLMEKLLPGNSIKTVGKKLICDQLIVSPIFIIQYFYATFFLEGKPISEATELLKQKFFTIYIADWMIWPPSQFINFYFVPLKYRVVYINMVQMFYNVFLCYVKNQRDDPVAEL